MQIHSVLVPTDFSPDTTRALELAIELARPTSATIHLLHSCYFGAHLGGFPEPVSIPRDFTENVLRAARAELEELAKQVAQAGLPCTTRVRELPPVSAIVAEAEECAADLIVMGTRGLTGLKHVLLGSVAERTVRLAPCPVVTVKAPH